MYRHVRRRIFALIRMACAAFAMAAASAHAQTCTVSMTAVAFGNVDVLTGAAADTTATLTVSCSGGGASGQRVCISLGAGSAGDSTSRILNGPGGGTARYELYSDASRTVKWGSWQTGYDLAGVQLDVAQNASTNLTVYARFAGSQQTDLAGTYTSTFTGDPFIQYADRSASPCPTGGLTASTSTSASANVVPSCNVSATNVNFGTIALLTSNKDAQGTLSIQCNATLPYAVSLSGGNAGATDPTQRKMALGGGNVTYGLYQDSARTQPWGDNPGTNTNSGTGNGALQNIAVYARIAPQTTPSPGTYSDTIIATVSY
jgi:spore coat protein U-like protein